ncbi:sugar phosphate isomerase/epimerase [Amycolatopsis sp. CA-128772]|uniref:sugar phosphate isomerase/epimerase family protein n=1 Tax=Amycolatopsis sp. CA-128772 TaxID=2073159 RepID=UPI000CD07476|nr:sugar phosphate isomerase/epimerase [Amycolatopsis sp. CA-128772]
MRLAFSTLGLPGLPLHEAADLATRTGWLGLELRCAPGETISPAMTRAERLAAVHSRAVSGVRALTVATYIGVAAPGPDDAVLARLRQSLQLAADLHARYVRVFPHAGSCPGGADPRAARRLSAVAGEAEDLGIGVLPETHDSPSRRRRRRPDSRSGRPAVDRRTVDLMHTWLASESPEATRDALGARLGYVQVKDIAGQHDRTPLRLGGGVLPIVECLRLLAAGCRVSWEYEAAWFPRAEPLPPLLTAAARYLNDAASAQDVRGGGFPGGSPDL